MSAPGLACTKDLRQFGVELTGVEEDALESGDDVRVGGGLDVAPGERDAGDTGVTGDGRRATGITRGGLRASRPVWSCDCTCAEARPCGKLGLVQRY